MLILRTSLFVFAAILCANTSASAATFLSANITNNQETTIGPLTTTTGAPRPISFGTATFTLNDAMTAMTFSATVFNIDVTGLQTADVNDNLVAAHIHASPTAVVGVNAPVVWGFFGAPDNDINPDDLVVTPFSSGVGGVFTSKWDAPEGTTPPFWLSCRTFSRITPTLTFIRRSSGVERFAERLPYRSLAPQFF